MLYDESASPRTTRCRQRHVGWDRTHRRDADCRWWQTLE